MFVSKSLQLKGNCFLCEINISQNCSAVYLKCLSFLHDCSDLQTNPIIQYDSHLLVTSNNELTRRRHDMGNSLGDETSCENSNPLTYLTLNVLAPNGQ